jgi:hypothetical protein
MDFLMKSFRRASRCPCSHTLDSESGHSGSLLGQTKGSKSEMDGLLVKDDFQKRFVDRDFSVVLDESEFPEFVHKEIHARPRGADHFRERFLRDRLQHLLGLILFAITRKE